MPDYLFLMHDDIPKLGIQERDHNWGLYIGRLRASGNFKGGSAIGAGVCARKSGAEAIVTGHLSGFIRVEPATWRMPDTYLSAIPCSKPEEPWRFGSCRGPIDFPVKLAQNLMSKHYEPPNTHPQT